MPNFWRLVSSPEIKILQKRGYKFLCIILDALLKDKTGYGLNHKSDTFISYVKSKLSGIHHAQFGKHGYFFSWENEVTKNLSVAWFTGRNICRRHCMDLVSLGKSGKADLFEESRIYNLLH